jgi:hypothetical protein
MTLLARFGQRRLAAHSLAIVRPTIANSILRTSSEWYARNFNTISKARQEAAVRTGDAITSTIATPDTGR